MRRAIFLLFPWAREVIFPPDVRRELERFVKITGVFTPDEVLAQPQLLREVEIIFGGWGTPRLDERLLRDANALRILFYGGGSVHAVVSEAFWSRNLLVVSGSEQNAVPTAEFALGAVLMSLKHVWKFSMAMRLAQAYRPKDAPVPGAFGSHVGVVGVGKVGRRVIQLLRPFGVNVLAWDSFLPGSSLRAMQAEPVGLDDLFARSDVVTLHLAARPETAGMIKEGHFDRMPAGATFINTARGAIIDEAGLIRVLRRRTDLTAVLDVTDPEPPAVDSELFRLPNVVLTPHIAGAMDRECARMGQMTVAALRKYLAGERPFGLVEQKDLQCLA